MIEAPTEDLSKFKYEDLLQFAMDSRANNAYQQGRIAQLEAQLKGLEKTMKILQGRY